MNSAQEELTRRFYGWERRGRGWLQSPQTVDIEPPFRPFYGHYLSPPTAAADDGRHKTFFSRFLSLFAPQNVTPPLRECVADSDPEPVPWTHEGDLVELAIALPEGTRIDHDAMEGFLISAAGCANPIAFEIVGSAERIGLQFTARDADALHVEEALRAFFPSIGVARLTDHVHTAWRNAGENTAIVECALAREFMLPLRTFLRADPDPLIAIFAALTSLEDRDFGMVQVLFHAARCEWSASVRAAVTDFDGKPFFIDAPELTHLALDKVAHPLFAVVIRIAAASVSEAKAVSIANRVAASLAHFGRPDGNELVVMGNEQHVDLETNLLERTSHRTGMLLSSGELVGFVHPPSASVVVPKLMRRIRRSKPAPAMAIGQKTILGVNEHAGRSASVGLNADQRMRHVHVLGTSGSGKSNFLLDLIQQTIEVGDGVALLDPHGDLVDEALARIPDRRDDDVVLLDASDPEHAVGLNLLAAHSEQERTLLSSDLVAVFRRLSTTWGDQMNTVLANAIQAFLLSREGGSLADLRRFLIENDFRHSFLATVDDDEIIYYWTREYPLLVGKPAAPILTRLDSFLRPKPLRAMLARRENKVDFREVIDKRRIFLAKLAQGVIGQENAALLGSVLVAKFHQAAISRQAVATDARSDFHLIIDEFQELVTPSLASILSGTRKYRLGLTAAHQDLRQIYAADPSVAAALLANAATRVVFRVGDDDAKKLADGFTAFDPQALTTLSVGEAICRVDRADHDFNIQTRLVPPLDRATADLRRAHLRDLSNRKYAVPIVDAARNTSLTPTGTERPSIRGHRRAADLPARKDGLQRLIRDVIESDDGN